MMTIPADYYGDDNRWFIGTVVNSNPPPGLEGRVKVRIYGVHNPYTGDIGEKDLPWAQVVIPTTEGGSSGIGRIPQLVSGTFVFGIFMDGKSSQLPLIIGSIPRTEFPTSVQQRLQSSSESYDYNQERIQNVVATDIENDLIQIGNLTQRRSQCMKFFIDNGYSVMHSSVITGSLEYVSNFTIYTSDESDRQGIGQWSKTGAGNRYDDLRSFSLLFTPKTDWKRFSIQLQFVLYELRNKINLANNKLLSTDNIKDACDVFPTFYFRRSDVKSVLNFAQTAYDEALA